jgi:hypothetical protein
MPTGPCAVAVAATGGLRDMPVGWQPIDEPILQLTAIGLRDAERVATVGREARSRAIGYRRGRWTIRRSGA